VAVLVTVRNASSLQISLNPQIKWAMDFCYAGFPPWRPRLPDPSMIYCAIPNSVTKATIQEEEAAIGRNRGTFHRETLRGVPWC
jgi:hypothetical protein